MTLAPPAPPAAPPVSSGGAAGVRRTRHASKALPVALPVGVQTVALIVLAAVALRPLVAPRISSPAFDNGTTIFIAICIQALPYLVLGVLLSGAIAAYVSPALMARLLPRRDLLAVPVAGLAGAALPGCECGSIPVADRLITRGASPAAAMAFLLSAPAVNPVVLIATSVAFPGRPGMVAGRFVGGFATAVVTALLWQRLGGRGWLRPRTVPSSADAGGSRWQVLTDTALHDLLHAGGFLVIGAAAAAALQTLLPRSILTSVASSPVLAVLVMAGLAVVLAICSQADAFVAASFTQFSLTSRLVFLVVGPAVDLKLIALQVGTFGRTFAARFAPLTLAVAVGCGLLAGAVLL